MSWKMMKVTHGDIFGGNDLILCDILSRLPVKSLMRFKLVCKHWRFLIKEDKYLINLHLSQWKTRREGKKLLISPVLGRKMSLFLCDLFQGGPAVPLLGRRTADNLDETLMLNPINGLVCFVKPFEGSVLIYNPSTGENTSWIETTTRKKLLKNQVAVGTSRMRWGFGFGFDPATKEHKVVSVFETIDTERKTSDENPYGLDIQNCEVLTVGVQNEWREIDKSYVPGNIVGASVYVNGVIYWLDEHHKVHEVIMAFDVGSEKFNKVIVIPTFINNRWRDYPIDGGVQEVSIYVELVEIDGHIALLEKVDENSISVWIYEDDNIIDGNWTEEKISLPFNLWDSFNDYIAFEAIIGTDLIIFGNRNQHTDFETLYYYNRKSKKIENQVNITGICRDHDAGLKFSTFVESLLPVQSKRDQHSCYTLGITGGRNSRLQKIMQDIQAPQLRGFFPQAPEPNLFSTQPQGFRPWTLPPQQPNISISTCQGYENQPDTSTQQRCSTTRGLSNLLGAYRDLERTSMKDDRINIADAESSSN